MRPVHMKFSSFLAATLMFSPLFGALEFKDSEGKHLDVRRGIWTKTKILQSKVEQEN